GGGLGQAARALQALGVLARAKNVQLLLLGVPVGADTFEDAGAVVQRVRREADLRVREAYKVAVVIRPGLLGDLEAQRRGLRLSLFDARHISLHETKKPP